MRRLSAVLAAAVLLSGCGGGGGGGSSSTESAAGLWLGTTSDGRVAAGLVLSNGEFWFLYSLADAPNIIAGGVQGVGNTSGNTFTSSNARDYSLQFDTVTGGSLTANFAEGVSFDGTVTATAGGSVTFNFDYDARWELTPTLAQVAGTYYGEAATDLGTSSVTVTVQPNGDVDTVDDSGCVGFGFVAPRTDGNAYNLTVEFQGAPCANGTSTVTGVAVLDASGDLYAVGLNASRTNGFIFLGRTRALPMASVRDQ